MRRNPLIIGLLLLLGVVASARLWVQFGYPLLLKAQEASAQPQQTQAAPENLGPHAAFFDVAGNMSVAGMVKQKTGKNLPITLQVSLSSTPEEISQILSAAQGLKPVIRIVGLRYDTPSSDIDRLAANLNSSIVRDVMPAGTLVVFGNELNNLDREFGMCDAASPCPGRLVEAARAYVGQWNTFTDTVANNYIPVPAPPDQHNSIYDWTIFVDNAAGVYSGTLVANAYDLTSVGGGGISLYQDLEAKQGGKVVFFTEYGPHPNKSLQEHVDFFASNPPPLPATTLIPDKCQSQDHNDDLWLYYVDGKIYNKAGVQIDPATCAGGSDRGAPPEGDYYRRFVYPFYYDDPDNPLPLVKEIRQRLAEDYTVQCVRPAEYETFLGGNGNIFEMFHSAVSRQCMDELPFGACLFSPQASLVLTVDGLQNMFGVLRDENAAKWRSYDQKTPENTEKRSFLSRFESVEQWFGANNPSTEQYYDTTPDEIRETHQGPLYKLVDKRLQCVAATEILVAKYKLCKDWEQANPDLVAEGLRCPLDAQVAGTGYFSIQLLSALNAEAEKFVTLGGDNPAKVLCERYYSPEGGGRGIDAQLMEDVSRVDLYMEEAYRPAFLVMVTEVDPSSPGTSSQNTNATIRAQKDGQLIDNGSKHVVDFLVYHVPSTLTDTSEVSSNAPDVVTTTVRSIVPAEKTEEFEAQTQAERDVLRHQLVVNDAPNVPSPQIDCSRPECQEILLAALIDMVNVSDAQYGLGCESQHVAKRAETGSNPGSALNADDESTQLAATKLDGTLGQVEVGVEIQQYYDSNGSVSFPRSNAPRTKLFNISPYGYNVAYAAQSLQALIPAESQEHFKPKNGYLTTFEAPLGKNFEVFEDAANQYAVRTNAPSPSGIPYETKEVRGGIKLKDEDKPIALQFKQLATVFNHSTRAFTSLVVGHGTTIWNCATTIVNPNTNTQDFLRNCSRGGGSLNPDDLDQTPVNEYMNKAVATRKPGCLGFTPGNRIPIERSSNLCQEPNSITGKKEYEALFITSIDVPTWKDGNDGGPVETICTQSLYDSVGCTYSPDGPGKTPYVNLIAHEVNDAGVFTPNTGMTACEYIVRESQRVGVSPRLALAMWGEESNFGAYASMTGGEDFGVISQPSSRESGSIEPQLRSFLNTVKGQASYLAFLRKYSGEKDFTPVGAFCNNPQFPYRLRDFYNNIKL